MNTIQHSSPLLALVARRQCVQTHALRSSHTSYIINIAHSQCKSRQFAYFPSRLASTSTATRSSHREPLYNSTASQPEKLLKSTTITKTPPPIVAGEELPPTTPITQSLAPTQSTPPYIPDASVNPPSSTRPAPLDVPIRQENQSKVGHLIKIGRAYLTFYKRGLQAINASRKAAKQIRQRMAQHKSQFEAITKANPDIARQAMAEQTAPWTRAEFQLVRRSSHDMSRLPVFGLMFLVFGEFLPLVMFAFKNKVTPLLPYTVRLPAQVTAERQALLQHRAAVEQRWDASGTHANHNSSSIDTFATYGAEFFKLGPPLWPLSWQPRAMVLRHTRMYYEYLLYDDVLLGREGVGKLMDEEVVIAAIERGVWDDVAGMAELRRRLQRAVVKSLKPITDNSTTAAATSSSS